MQKKLKMGDDVLVQLVATFQKGLMGQTDVSQDFRDFEFFVDDNDVIHLDGYVASKIDETLS